jgi:syntaxin 1B/2/3
MSHAPYGSNPLASPENGGRYNQLRGSDGERYGQGGFQQANGGYGAQTQMGGYGDGGNLSTIPSTVIPIAPSSEVLSMQEFLNRIEGVRHDISVLTGNISQIATLHQRAITSPDSSNWSLEALVTRTQVLNTKIRDQIRLLEKDTARSGGNASKNSQMSSVKNEFRKQLEGFQSEELEYKKRYQEQIARQYRIVNPNATPEEVAEASTADWGNEGVFQTAVGLFYKCLFQSGLLTSIVLVTSKPVRTCNLSSWSCTCTPQGHSANRDDTRRPGTDLSRS